MSKSAPDFKDSHHCTHLFWAQKHAWQPGSQGLTICGLIRTRVKERCKSHTSMTPHRACWSSAALFHSVTSAHLSITFSLNKTETECIEAPSAQELKEGEIILCFQDRFLSVKALPKALCNTQRSLKSVERNFRE